MSLELDVEMALDGMAAGGVFPDVARVGTAPPWITYQQVGGESLVFLERTQPGKQNARVQISVWARNRAEASALGRAVADRLQSALQAYPLGQLLATTDPADGARLRGTRQDFSIWFTP